MRALQDGAGVVAEKVRRGGGRSGRTPELWDGLCSLASFIPTVIWVSRSLILSLSVVCHMAPESGLTIHPPHFLSPVERAYICEVVPAGPGLKGGAPGAADTAAD